MPHPKRPPAATSTGSTSTGPGPASPTGGIQTVTTADDTSTSGIGNTNTIGDNEAPSSAPAVPYK